MSPGYVKKHKPLEVDDVPSLTPLGHSSDGTGGPAVDCDGAELRYPSAIPSLFGGAPLAEQVAPIGIDLRSTRLFQASMTVRRDRAPAYSGSSHVGCRRAFVRMSLSAWHASKRPQTLQSVLGGYRWRNTGVGLPNRRRAKTMFSSSSRFSPIRKTADGSGFLADDKII